MRCVFALVLVLALAWRGASGAAYRGRGTRGGKEKVDAEQRAQQHSIKWKPVVVGP